MKSPLKLSVGDVVLCLAAAVCLCLSLAAVSHPALPKAPARFVPITTKLGGSYLHLLRMDGCFYILAERMDERVSVDGSGNTLGTAIAIIHHEGCTNQIHAR